MKTYFWTILFLSTFTLIGCELLDFNPGPTPVNSASNSSSNSSTPSDPNQVASQALGKQVYDANCASCHGDQGQGTLLAPGSIKGATNMQTIVLKGKGTMPAFPRITTAEVASMEIHLATFKVDLKAVSGKEYYQEKCASCHGANGEGNSKGYIVQQPVIGYSTFVIRNGRPGAGFADPMPKYTTTDLSDKQLTEMLTWLKSIPKPTTGKGLFNVYCANCHGADGRGGVSGEAVRGKNYLAIVRFGHGGTNYSNRRSYMPAWSASEITDAEVALMQAYGRTL